MVKRGNWQVALEELLLDTNNDFFHFNRQMHEKRLKGEWNWVNPNRRATGSSMAKSTNRLRRAVMMVPPPRAPPQEKVQMRRPATTAIGMDTSLLGE